MINQNLFSNILLEIEAQSQNGEVGTGTTTPSFIDTDVETPISGTDKAVDRVDLGTSSVSIVYSLSTAEADGNDITEFGVKDAADELKAHVVFTKVEKTTNNSLDIIYGVTLSQTNL